ncbi:hypothetical protein KSS87_001398 [Heliosperma pusillum]|nr:hypothetical protein KSS87_001398 [Heliosperma pusillum]
MFMRQEAEMAPVGEVSRRQAPVPPAAPQPKPVVVPSNSVGIASNVDVMMQPKPVVAPAKTVTAARNIDVMRQPTPAVVTAKTETLGSNVDVMMQPKHVVVPAKSVTKAARDIDVMMQPAPAVVPAKSVTVARSNDVTMQPAPAVVPAKTAAAARNIDVMMQPPAVVTAAKSANSASNVDVRMQSPSVVIPSKSATLASSNDGNNSKGNPSSNAKSVGVHENNTNDNNNNENDDDIDDDNELSNNVWDTASADGNNDGGVEEEGGCFWTSCPYCYYLYEYPKKYQDRTLRCQNCRRCFHGLQFRTPPRWATVVVRRIKSLLFVLGGASHWGFQRQFGRIIIKWGSLVWLRIGCPSHPCMPSLYKMEVGIFSGFQVMVVLLLDLRIPGGQLLRGQGVM